MGKVADLLYQGVFKRSATLLLFAMVGAVFVEESIDQVSLYTFNRLNQGKLWEHVKHRYVKEA